MVMVLDTMKIYRVILFSIAILQSGAFVAPKLSAYRVATGLDVTPGFQGPGPEPSLNLQQNVTNTIGLPESTGTVVVSPGSEHVVPTGSVNGWKVRTFWDVIITKVDAPHRIHSTSAAIGTFGGIAWIALMFASISDVFHLEGFINHAVVGVLLASYVGLIFSGTKYLPKGNKYTEYRHAYFATDLIMAADLLLWFFYSGGLAMNSSMVAVVSIVVLLGVLGDIESITADTPLRAEFYKNGLMDENIANPIWKYIAVLPTHSFLAFTKMVGALHLLVGGGTEWLESHPHAAYFGSAWYMTMLIVAAWSTFVQGTMPFRRVPFMGKKFRLDFDFEGMAVQMAPFLPLLPTALVGFQTGLLGEFYTMDDTVQSILDMGGIGTIFGS